MRPSSLNLPVYEASDRSFVVIADGPYAHFHLVPDGEIVPVEMREHSRAVLEIDIADAHRLLPFLRRHMHHAESVEHACARHRLCEYGLAHAGRAYRGTRKRLDAAIGTASPDQRRPPRRIDFQCVPAQEGPGECRS